MAETGKGAKQRRAWFQLHLSTCVVLMLAAGGLLGLNLQRQRASYGWPLPIIVMWHADHVSPSGSWSYKVHYDPYPPGIAINPIIWLSLLASCGAVCEWLIRRRKRRHA